jgi:hypothetical protein
MMTSSDRELDPIKRTHGVLAEFKSAADLYHAAEKVRDAGFRFWDCHTPFPVHGLDDAMGVKRSILPKLVFVGGLMGTLTALGLQFGTQVLLYPTTVQAKPGNIFSIPAYFPVTFELTILFSAFTILLGVLALMQLPKWNHPLFESENFRRFSDDAFFICIEQRDPKFRTEETKKFLESLGGTSIEVVQTEE